MSHILVSVTELGSVTLTQGETMQTLFDRLWTFLSDRGVTDGLGSTEYERVKREWEERASIFEMIRFMNDRANQCPNLGYFGKIRCLADAFEESK